MSSRDRFIENLFNQPDSATQRLMEQATRAQPSSAIQQIIDSRMRDLDRINIYGLNAISNAATSSVARIIEQMARSPVLPEHIRTLHNIAATGITNQVAEAIRQSAVLPFENLHSQAIKALIESADSMRKVGINRIIESIAEQTKNIPYAFLGSIANSASLAALKQVQSQIPGILDAINSTFAGTAAEVLRRALEDRDEEAFARFEQLIDDKLDELPDSRITAEGLWFFILQILIPLLALGTSWYQVYDSKQTSKTQAEQFAQVKELLQRIAYNTEQHIPEKDDNSYYVVERQVTLKIKPTSKSATIAILFPNQKVRLEKMNHKWIYVEYFDYLEGIPKYGWANKKYFIRVSK